MPPTPVKRRSVGLRSPVLQFSGEPLIGCDLSKGKSAVDDLGRFIDMSGASLVATLKFCQRKPDSVATVRIGRA